MVKRVDSKQRKELAKIRYLVYHRDNCMCVRCEMTLEEHIDTYGSILLVHHKRGEENSLENLETLCMKCHNQLHGSGFPRGKPLSELRKSKISKALKGRTMSKQARKNLSEVLKLRFKDKTKHPCYGKTCSKSTRLKISKAITGTKHSEEVRKRMSEAHKGHKHSKETCSKMSKSHIGKHFGVGRKLTEEHKRNVGKGVKLACLKKKQRKNKTN